MAVTLAAPRSPTRCRAPAELLRSKVLRTFAETRSVLETASRLGVPPATVLQALEQTGLVNPEHIELAYRPTVRPWDEDSLRLLTEMMLEGWHPQALAIFFNRPVLDVELAVRWLGLPVPGEEGGV